MEVIMLFLRLFIFKKDRTDLALINQAVIKTFYNKIIFPSLVSHRFIKPMCLQALKQGLAFQFHLFLDLSRESMALTFGQTDRWPLVRRGPFLFLNLKLLIKGLYFTQLLGRNDVQIHWELLKDRLPHSLDNFGVQKKSPNFSQSFKGHLMLKSLLSHTVTKKDAIRLQNKGFNNAKLLGIFH